MTFRASTAARLASLAGCMAFLAAGCRTESGATREPPLALRGASLARQLMPAPPEGDSWERVSREDGVAFCRNAAGSNDLMVAAVLVRSIPAPFASEERLFSYLRRTADRRYMQVRLEHPDGRPAVGYETLMREGTGQGAGRLVRTRGVMIVHPDDRNFVVDIGYSRWNETGELGEEYGRLGELFVLDNLARFGGLEPVP